MFDWFFLVVPIFCEFLFAVRTEVLSPEAYSDSIIAEVTPCSVFLKKVDI